MMLKIKDFQYGEISVAIIASLIIGEMKNIQMFQKKWNFIIHPKGKLSYIGQLLQPQSILILMIFTLPLMYWTFLALFQSSLFTQI